MTVSWNLCINWNQLDALSKEELRVLSKKVSKYKLKKEYHI